MASTPLNEGLETLLDKSFLSRQPELDEPHDSALRLFAGFYEGFPEITVDLFGPTLVIHNYSDHPEKLGAQIELICRYYRQQLPWIEAILLKTRNANQPASRNGILLFGSSFATEIREANIRYAIDLQLNQDTSFYLDTRNLRAWLRTYASGKTVLNTFAYTGSLGVAALSGKAQKVIQIDLSRKFLNVAKQSYTLNGLPIHKPDFVCGDFWGQTAHFRRTGVQFDCVILDPPLFARTSYGTVDLVRGIDRLINKVRPLVKHNGWLIAINNALFVSGAEYLKTLESLGKGGFMEIVHLIQVPPDCTGYPGTRCLTPPADPSPFNHPTKIVILRVQHKTAA